MFFGLHQLKIPNQVNRTDNHRIGIVTTTKKHYMKQKKNELYSPKSNNFTSAACLSASSLNLASIFFERSWASLSLDALTAQPIINTQFPYNY